MQAEYSQVPILLNLLKVIPNWIPGKTRISNFLFKQCSLNKPFVIQNGKFIFFLPSLEEPIGRGIVSDGYYDGETLGILKQFLKKDSIFVDIGANIGFFSIYAGKLLCPEGKVISLEASPSIFSYFKKNIEINNIKNVLDFNNAVYSTSGKDISFYDAPDAKFGMGGLANRFGSNEIKVKTITVDEIIDEKKIGKVDLIKIDVEGFELEAFMGAKNLLTNDQAPIITFEFADWCEKERQGATPGDAQKYLRSLGYKTQPISDWLKKPNESTPVLTKGSANMIAWK